MKEMKDKEKIIQSKDQHIRVVSEKAKKLAEEIEGLKGVLKDRNREVKDLKVQDLVIGKLDKAEYEEIKALQAQKFKDNREKIDFMLNSLACTLESNKRLREALK